MELLQRNERAPPGSEPFERITCWWYDVTTTEHTQSWYAAGEPTAKFPYCLVKLVFPARPGESAKMFGRHDAASGRAIAADHKFDALLVSEGFKVDFVPGSRSHLDCTLITDVVWSRDLLDVPSDVERRLDGLRRERATVEQPRAPAAEADVRNPALGSPPAVAVPVAAPVAAAPPPCAQEPSVPIGVDHQPPLADLVSHALRAVCYAVHVVWWMLCM